MKQDRFFTYEQMEALSRDLEAAGFKHVKCLHLVDPEWRKMYRSSRPELENTAWTISLQEGQIHMPQIRALIDVCERHRVTFWLNTVGNDDPQLYALIGDAELRKGDLEACLKASA